MAIDLSCARTSVSNFLLMPNDKRKEIISDFNYVFVGGEFLYFYKTLVGALQDGRRRNLFTIDEEGYPKAAVTFD